MDMEIISAAEAKAMFPLLEEQYFIGALFDRAEGHVDPTGVTRAYAACARQAGAEIYQHTWVTDLRQRPDGTWTSSPTRARSTPSTSSTPAACGPARWAG